MGLVNIDILRNPLNWLTIWVILILGGLICDVAYQYHTTKDNS